MALFARKITNFDDVTGKFGVWVLKTGFGFCGLAFVLALDFGFGFGFGLGFGFRIGIDFGFGYGFGIGIGFGFDFGFALAFEFEHYCSVTSGLLLTRAHTLDGNPVHTCIVDPGCACCVDSTCSSIKKKLALPNKILSIIVVGEPSLP